MSLVSYLPVVSMGYASRLFSLQVIDGVMSSVLLCCIQCNASLLQAIDGLMPLILYLQVVSMVYASRSLQSPGDR